LHRSHAKAYHFILIHRPEDLVFETILHHPEAIRLLYKDFKQLHDPDMAGDVSENKSFSWSDARNGRDLESALKKMMTNDDDWTVFQSFVTFNKAITKTNFFLGHKTALSFELEPTFLLGMC
jgi:glutamate dehydrogenase